MTLFGNREGRWTHRLDPSNSKTCSAYVESTGYSAQRRGVFGNRPDASRNFAGKMNWFALAQITPEKLLGLLKSGPLKHNYRRCVRIAQP